MVRWSKPKGEVVTYEVIVHHRGKPANTFGGFIVKAINMKEAEPKARKHAKKYGLVFDYLFYKRYPSKKGYLYPQAK